MKADVLDLEGKKSKSIELPIQFNEEYRPDLIKNACLVVQASKRQPYGADASAGKKYSAKLSRRRRDFKTAYGRGISRVPRKTMSRRGTQFSWRGAFAPGTVGGRRSHPPKAEKVFRKKISKKENRKAIRSAISATLDINLVRSHGHLFRDLPLIVASELERLSKTKELKKALVNLGLKEELERVSVKKIRAGKGKTRGRKYKRKNGPLIIVSKACELLKHGKNIPGLSIEQVNRLNADLLAPGTNAARLVIWTDGAIERLSRENLFLNRQKKENGSV